MSNMTLNYWMMVERYPTLKMRLTVQFRLWNLLSTWHRTCQLANCLLCFDVGLSAFCLKKKEKKTPDFEKIIKEIPKDVNVIPVGLGNAMFSNRLCPKNLPRHWTQVCEWGLKDSTLFKGMQLIIWEVLTTKGDGVVNVDDYGKQHRCMHWNLNNPW